MRELYRVRRFPGRRASTPYLVQSTTRPNPEHPTAMPGEGLRAGLSRLVAGQNHHSAAVAFAFALGADPWVVGKSHVHYPAFGGGHRFQ